MRIVIACLAVAACATGGMNAKTPAERLSGCWISRDAGVITMRWRPDAARPGAMLGQRTAYGQAGAANTTAFSLEPSDLGASFCAIDREGVATQCWRVAEGQGGSLEGGRAFIDAHSDRLRIEIVGDGANRLIFFGRREGCD